MVSFEPARKVRVYSRTESVSDAADLLDAIAVAEQIRSNADFGILSLLRETGTSSAGFKADAIYAADAA